MGDYRHMDMFSRTKYDPQIDSVYILVDPAESGRIRTPKETITSKIDDFKVETSIYP